jgi:hypothetical protein
MAAEATVFGSTAVLGIVRFQDGGDVTGTLDALAWGGSDLFEIAIDTPARWRPSAVPQAREGSSASAPFAPPSRCMRAQRPERVSS